MDPSKGASTWALGSHRWVKNIGILIKNARMKIISYLKLLHKVVEYTMFILAFIHRIPIRSGNEAVIVYIIRYIPAWRRSGWDPDLVISNRVGINTISNII